MVLVLLLIILVVVIVVISKNNKKKKEIAEQEERRKRFEESMRLKKEREEAERAKFESELADITCVEVKVEEANRIKRDLAEMPEIKFSNITKKTNLDKLFPLVVIDTETTGLNPASGEIIEVSAIKYDIGFKPISCFTTLLKPHRKIPKDATEVNHITNEMVEDKPYFADIISSLSEYISGCNIAGHNLKFDLQFLFVSGLPLSSKVKYYDTLELAKHTLLSDKSKVWDKEEGRTVLTDESDVSDYKLCTLCDYYNIYPSNAHRALSDVYATGKVMEHLIEDKTS